MGLLDRCKALALALIVAFQVGCGSAPVKIDSKLQPYVDEFSRQFGRVVDWVPTTFEDLEGDWVGVCETGPDGPKVKIDPEYWDEADEGEKESLIMHEYGHCVLDRDHEDALIIKDGIKIPKSVMNTYTFSGAIYLKYKEHYMKELFGR